MPKKKIALALQGGGSHGAFTWGALEKIFEEDVFDIVGFCGTSAGALNAAIATYGLHKNGNKEAIELLETFWKRVSNDFLFFPTQATLLDKFYSAGNIGFSPGYIFFNLISSFFSPYEWNPLDINPLKSILLDLIDFNELKKSQVKLFVCATNVKTSLAKIFNLKQISMEALLASTCLPMLFKAVKIDNEYFWDGGYGGNPPLFPLMEGTTAKDILLLQTNPFRIKKVPTKADQIFHRINELSFNSSLAAELRLAYFKDELLSLGYNMGGKLRKIHFHAISADDALEEFDASSKFNISWDFINLLRNRGRASADHWLKKNYDKIGNETSADFTKDILQEFM